MGTVYPVFENVFKIGVKGRDSATEEDFKTIADMESFSPSFDGKVEEWTPMELKGWTRRLKTGQSVKISFKGKRNVGDPGNDYIAGLATKTGNDANSILDWTAPDGTVYKIPCVINVTALGGDSTAVDALEFDCESDGQPTVTPNH